MRATGNEEEQPSSANRQCERRLGTKRSRSGKTQVEFWLSFLATSIILTGIFHLDVDEVSNSMQGCAAPFTHALEGLRVGTDV